MEFDGRNTGEVEVAWLIVLLCHAARLRVLLPATDSETEVADFQSDCD